MSTLYILLNYALLSCMQGLLCRFLSQNWLLLGICNYDFPGAGKKWRTCCPMLPHLQVQSQLCQSIIEWEIAITLFRNYEHSSAPVLNNKTLFFGPICSSIAYVIYGSNGGDFRFNLHQSTCYSLILCSFFFLTLIWDVWPRHRSKILERSSFECSPS